MVLTVVTVGTVVTEVTVVTVVTVVTPKKLIFHNLFYKYFFYKKNFSKNSTTQIVIKLKDSNCEATQ